MGHETSFGRSPINMAACQVRVTAHEGKFAIGFGRSPDVGALSLPSEVALMIFGELDERSLTRCVFVCTSWYAFISKEKTLWLRHLERSTHLPPHVIASALDQYPVTTRKSPVRRPDNELYSAESAHQSTLEDKKSSHCRSTYGDVAVTENVLELAVVQHGGKFHRVLASIHWLDRMSSLEDKLDVLEVNRHVTLEASGKTPQKVGRHTVLLKESPTGPFTFHQLDSTSSQLVQKEYQVPHDFDPSAHVLEFLPQSEHSIFDIPQIEVELESAPFAELVVCLVRQRRCDSAAASTTNSHGAVTRVLWYDPDTLSIAAECDVSGKVAENDVCIFCQFCGLVAFIASGDTAHTSDGCRSSLVTAWSPYTPATPIQLSVTPFCQAQYESVYSFLAGRQEGICAAVHDGTKSGICSFHRIVQCVITFDYVTKLYSILLTTHDQVGDCARLIEAGEEHVAKIAYGRFPPNVDEFRIEDEPPMHYRLTAVLSSDNLIVSLFRITVHPVGRWVFSQLLVDVDASLQSFSTPHFHYLLKPPLPHSIYQSYDDVYISGPTHTLGIAGNAMTIYSTLFQREVMSFKGTGSAVYLWDYDIVYRLPRPEGILSDSPLFIDCLEPVTPPSKHNKDNTTEQ